MIPGQDAGSTGSQRGQVRLAAPEVAEQLSAYLLRLRRLEDTAVVRLVVRGSAVGVFACPPMQVITFRAFPAAGDGVGPLDVTVRADQVRSSGAMVELPPAVTTPAWAGVLPPRGGWAAVAALSAASVVEAVGVGVQAFKERSAGVPEAHRTPAVLQRIATEIWSAELAPGLPLRAAHAASVAGLLSAQRGGELGVQRAAGWLRLEAHHGVVFLRRSDAPGITFA